MPLELLPWEEKDIDAFVDLNTEAFGPDLHDVLFPNGFSTAHREFKKTISLTSHRRHGNLSSIWKVIDTDLPDSDPLNKIVGHAKWRFYPNGQNAEERAREKKDMDAVARPPPRSKAQEAFHAALDEVKKTYIGDKPYAGLQVLATRESHRRRGVATMLLRKGIELANEYSLPIYLESSPMAKPVYERVGFELLGWMPFDAREFGSDREMRHAVMMRPAGKPEEYRN